MLAQRYQKKMLKYIYQLMQDEGLALYFLYCKGNFLSTW